MKPSGLFLTYVYNVGQYWPLIQGEIPPTFVSATPPLPQHMYLYLQTTNIEKSDQTHVPHTFPLF